MKVRELLVRLGALDPDSEVWIEWTEDEETDDRPLDYVAIGLTAEDETCAVLTAEGE